MEQLSHLHSLIFDPARIPPAIAAILAAVFVGMITGPVAGNANPFYWLAVDKIFGGFGDRLDRKHRPASDLMFRGFIVMTFVLFFSLLIANYFVTVTQSHMLYGFSQTLPLLVCITSGAVWFSLLRLYFALEKDRVVPGAYYAISCSTRTNLSNADDYTITRTAMSFSARSFDKGLICPIFWYLLGGLPALFAYTGLAALAWRFGKSGFTKGFGAIPLTLEKLLGFIPSVFAAILLTLASLFTPKATLHKSIASWFGKKGRVSYEQGGYPLSIIAWALNVGLGGPSLDLAGSAIKSGWAGPEGASAKISHTHLQHAIYINVIAHLLLLATLLGAYLWAGNAIPGFWQRFTLFMG